MSIQGLYNIRVFNIADEVTAILYLTVKTHALIPPTRWKIELRYDRSMTIPYLEPRVCVTK